MASKALVTPEQYLAAHFEREPELVHGELVERPLPNKTHGRIQALLVLLLGRAGYSCTEVRMRIAEDLYRLPDFAFFENEPEGEVPDRPPLLIVEIASPDDRLIDMLTKFDEYARWGVSNLWLVEPTLREFRTYDHGSLQRVDRFELPQFGFTITPADLFA
ncbi:MAG TPA: Uma2 family endonuclease [Bryobacteraceae bacterium]|nr:Uma2 family endonuclease [Bryobacteraceae bacterium]